MCRLKLVLLGLVVLSFQLEYSLASCPPLQADTSTIIVGKLQNHNECRIHLEVFSDADRMPLSGSNWQILNRKKQPIASSVILKNGTAEILFNNLKKYPYVLVRYLGFKDQLIYLRPFKGRAVNIKIYLKVNEVWIE